MNCDREEGRDQLNIFSDTELCVNIKILLTVLSHKCLKKRFFWDSCWHLLGLLSLVCDEFMKTEGIFPHNVEGTSYYGHSLPAALLAHQNCLLT